MQQLARTENTQSSYLIPRINYTQLYNQLKAALPKELWQLFAKPDIGQSHTLWLCEELSGHATVYNFSTLNEADKNLAAAEIEDKKETIIAQLSGHPILGALVESLFQIAEQDDIKWVENGSESFAVLTRWGAKSNLTKTAINPLTTAIARPGNNRSNVKIQVRYNDGDFGSELSFLLMYKGLPKSYITDEQGCCALGKFLHGSQLRVYFMYGNEERYQHDFEVDTRETYLVQIPKTGDVVLTVVNQDDEAVAGLWIALRYKNADLKQQTNGEGSLVLTDLEQGETLEATVVESEASANLSGKGSYLIAAADNNFVLKLHQSRPANLNIQTIDQNDHLLAAVELRIIESGKTQTFHTDENGNLQLNGIYEEGQTLQILAPNFGNASFTHNITSKESALVLKLILPEPTMVTVKLIDAKGAALPGLKIDFSTKTFKESRTTDTEAICSFLPTTFVHGETVKAKVYYPKKNKKGTVKTVIYRKNFKYDENQSDYTIQLNKKRNWWWLLLLLPLLLLIQCEKTVPVKVIDGQTLQPIAAAATTFGYQRQNLFRPWGFFTNDSTRYAQTTDSVGVTTYKKLKYSLYSLLFYNNMKATIRASCNCYATDTIRPKFHYLSDTAVVKLQPAFELLDFLVVDSFDNEPLPEAIVTIRAEFAGKVYRDTAMTNPAGLVYFKKIPYCAHHIDIRAQKPGYESDSIMHKTIPDLKGELTEKRKLRLVPETAKLIFFVEDCVTGKKLPGATVIIDVEGRKRKQRALTNVNGKGKGEYNDARMTDEIELIAEFPPRYKPGRLPKYKVRDFINLPDSLRTICLEPLPEPCNSQHSSGGEGVTVNEYNMQDPKMKFNIQYNMLTVKDRMIVYCGRKNSPGKVLHDTGYLSGIGTIPIDMASCDGSSWITVKVIGPNGTSWDYQIECAIPSIGASDLEVK